jgi:hypothetical protein
VMAVKSAQQEAIDRQAQRDADRDKVINYILGLLTLIVGVMALERIPRIISLPISWIRSIWRKVFGSNAADPGKKKRVEAAE